MLCFENFFMLRMSKDRRLAQFISVAQLGLTLQPHGLQHTRLLSLHHQLLELLKAHVHWVSHAIQTSHPLSFPSLPPFNLSKHQGLFQWAGSSHQVAKALELQLQHQSFQWIFRTDYLEDWLVWSPWESKRLSRVFSNTTVQKHQFFSAQLSFWSNSHIHVRLLEKP